MELLAPPARRPTTFVISQSDSKAYCRARSLLFSIPLNHSVVPIEIGRIMSFAKVFGTKRMVDIGIPGIDYVPSLVFEVKPFLLAFIISFFNI